MVGIGRLAAGAAMMAVTAFHQPASAQEATLRAPAVGDPVVVYTHRFKPEDFNAGRNLVIAGFGEAMTKHGGDRLTFFIVDEGANEVVAVSIFPQGASVEDWHQAMSRHEVLDQLEPLRREPLIRQEFRLGGVHVVGQ
jgi:hypothetical protein